MLFGPERTERILGLHRRPCRACTPASERLVTQRRWSYQVLGMPLVALDARWRRCAGCRRRAAMPRLSLPTTVLATFILAFLLGLDVVAYGDLFVWVLLAGFWGVWLAGHVVDSFLDRTLIPVPAATFRTHKPAPVKQPARRRALRSLAGQRPVHRWARLRRLARGPMRVARRLRTRRERTGTAPAPIP